MIVDCGLSFTTHIENQVSKANKIVGLIRRSFTFLDKESMKLLFVSLVRPLLEFANVAWSPKHQKDIDLIEQVQRRATRLVPSLKHLSYEQRLEEMKLPSLCFRRKRGDLIEVYKYMNDFYTVNKDMFVVDISNRTRGHNHKIVKQRCNLDLRKKFFSLRIVNEWNSLPASIVEAPTLNSFKARIDKHYMNEMYKC